MKNQSIIITALLIMLGVVSASIAADNVVIELPEAGSVSKQQGLEAWSRIYEVASHPRCANCHVGESDRPMWSGPTYGEARVHGMNVQAGTSRIGVETLLCQTCHITLIEERENANDIPHAAPRVASNWLLAPVDAHWFGQTSEQICAQLRNPETNGNRDPLEIAEHLDHDVILHWAWKPGGGREPAPYSLQEHVNDILAWGAADTPCPQD